jgi:hypothetical protein
MTTASAHDRAVYDFARAFMRNIPSDAAAAGQWPAPKMNDLLERKTGIPDGTYRVLGWDWVFRFSGGRLVEAKRAVPPDYGGPDVQIIAWEVGGDVTPARTAVSAT